MSQSLILASLIGDLCPGLYCRDPVKQTHMINGFQLFRRNHYDLQLFSAFLLLQLMILIDKVHRGLIDVIFVSMHIQAAGTASVDLNSRIIDVFLWLHGCLFYFL